jgi:muconolactone delta-isomerase
VEFLVEFDVRVPDEAAETEVEERVRGEASAAAKLANEGYLVPLWKPAVAPGEAKALGLFRADSEAELDGLLGGLLLDPLPRARHLRHRRDPAHRRRPGRRQLKHSQHRMHISTSRRAT